MSRISLRRVFILAFVVSFALTAAIAGLFVGIPSFLGGALSASTAPGFIVLLAVVSLLAGLIYGVIAVGLYFVWRAIPTSVQVVIVVVLLVGGLALLSPELDVVAALGVLLTALGVKPGGR